MEEVEQICTRIAIIDKGKKIAEGTKEELKGLIKNTETIDVEVRFDGAVGKPDAPLNTLMDKLRELPHVYEVTDVISDNEMKNGDYIKLTIRCSCGRHNLTRVLGTLQESDVHIGKVYSELPTLNDVFLEITGKELRDTD
jgi:ABC-2 type transport system ATP-binding protein